MSSMYVIKLIWNDGAYNSQNMTNGQHIYQGNPDLPPRFKGRGLGHMSDVPVAAFDPIFWLHHCNIDRLFATWQTLNEHAWFPDDKTGVDPGAKDSLSSFHYGKPHKEWNSNRGRSWKSLGYDYDHLAPSNFSGVGDDEYQQQLRKTLTGFYPDTSQRLRNQPNYTFESPQGQSQFNDYIINVLYDPYALEELAYSILFFIESEPDQVPKTFIGQVSTFTARILQGDDTVACANCVHQSTRGVLRRAQIPITLQLVELAEKATFGGPGTLDHDVVETILARALRWTFCEIGGVKSDESNFPRTEIAVLMGRGTHGRESSDFASYGGYKKLGRVTRDRLYGANGTDEDLIKDD